MDGTVIAAVIGGAATTLAAIIAGALLYWQVHKQHQDEKDTLRIAVHAEFERVCEVVEAQLKWLPTNQDNPMNWLPIHTPVWDASVSKIGGLDPDQAGTLTRFFGYVTWSNDVLKLRSEQGAYSSRAAFVETYVKALTAVYDARNPRVRASTGVIAPAKGDDAHGVPENAANLGEPSGTRRAKEG
jgi:hypothetical protein